MAVPSTINDLSTNDTLNSPSGTDQVFPDLDNFIRKYGSFIATLRDGKLSASAVSAFMLTVLDDANAGAARVTLGAVSLTDAQTIAGVKTFSSAPISSVPAAAPTELVRKQEFDAAVGAASFIGQISPGARLTPPAGWLLIDGKTIGSAASGATSRANADTLALFTVMWDFSAAAVPIYTSTGAPSTRGASAAADFAANKRLALYTPDGGAFIRMWAPSQTVDPGRVAGVVSDAVIANLPFSITADDGDSQTGAGKAISRVQINGVGDDVFGQGTGEVRNFSAVIPASNSTTAPYNLPLPHYIRYA